MEFLIEKFNDDAVGFADEAVKAGHTVHDLLPRHAYELPPARGFVYGSIGICRNLQGHPGFTIFATAENYLCSRYYLSLGRFLFNDRYEFVTLGELIHRKEELFRRFGREDCIFLRPDSGDKLFSGALVELQHFEKDLENILSQCSTEVTAVISTPKTVNAEWRFYVARDGIVTFSTYRHRGKRVNRCEAPAGAQKICEAILAVGYCPDEMFALDICEDAGGDYWLLELNAFSCSGLYASDKAKLVAKISSLMT